jgi:GNAT superfamily N-acetyltransferase
MEADPGRRVMSSGRRPVRTYLEMLDASALRPAAEPAPPPRIERVEDCPASFWRFLYREVGRRYHWVDRLGWTDAEIYRYLKDPSLQLWLMWVKGAPAGYFELRRDSANAIEIAYFGLLDEFTGRGLGGHMLTEAVKQAWALGAVRVWLHTSTLDHPGALPNYLKRGFTITRTEPYELTPAIIRDRG